jgi:hypothetical protein
VQSVPAATELLHVIVALQQLPADRVGQHNKRLTRSTTLWVGWQTGCWHPIQLCGQLGAAASVAVDNIAGHKVGAHHYCLCCSASTTCPPSRQASRAPSPGSSTMTLMPRCRHSSTCCTPKLQQVGTAWWCGGTYVLRQPAMLLLRSQLNATHNKQAHTTALSQTAWHLVFTVDTVSDYCQLQCGDVRQQKIGNRITCINILRQIQVSQGCSLCCTGAVDLSISNCDTVLACSVTQYTTSPFSDDGCAHIVA